MKKQLAPPENWQDFEDLCKHLFGELWNCKYSIRKNGRLGQDQNGVDVYGMPEGKTEYWGVQSKGKDTYTHKVLTKKEIDIEIEKAKNFKPKLEVFIFATTAPKDAKVEEYIREKNYESKKSGNFEILLYDWDDLTDEIRRHRNTYNWYVLNKQFEDEHNLSVQFDDGLDKKLIKPKFLKTITSYKYLEKPLPSLKPIESFQPKWMIEPPIGLFGEGKVNYSWCSFEIVIENTGNITIEDWKLWLQFDENVKKIDDDFPDNGLMDILRSKDTAEFRTTFDNEEDHTILYSPYKDKPLVPKDSRSFKSYFIPVKGVTQTIVKWELLSRNYNAEGELTIILKPEYEIKNIVIDVQTKEEERSEEEISEFIK